MLLRPGRENEPPRCEATTLGGMENVMEPLRQRSRPVFPRRMAAARRWIILAGLTCALPAAAASHPPDSLRSWNGGPAKSAIVQFVRDITTEGGPYYVPPAGRVVVFSDDGTLSPELPMPAALAYAADRMKPLLSKHPKWRTKEPFRSAITRNAKSLSTAGQRGVLELMGATHAGMTTEEFDLAVAAWLGKTRNPRLNRPYLLCAYQPMLELVDYLRGNGFTLFIVARGAAEFSRIWMAKLYGIPPEQVIGGTARTRYQVRKGAPVLIRRPEFDILESGAGKPAAIYRKIGCRPLAAFGSSDDDLEMLEWVAGGPGRRLSLIVRHTDGGNEFSYDRKAVFGRLDKALDAARKRGWTIVDMTKDWSRVFSKADR